MNPLERWELPCSMSKKSRRKTSRTLIVVFTTAIVLVPVLKSLLPGEVARWYLAAAMNAYEQHDDISVNEFVRRARRWNVEIESEFNYWQLRYHQIPDSQPDLQVQLYRQASEKVPRFRALGLQLSEKLADSGNFSQAIAMLEFMHENQSIIAPGTLNNFAYFRSLASTNLDKALEEINRALEFEKDEISFRDTRAWVYYQMGRLSEALQDADFAVKQTLKIVEKQQLFPKLKASDQPPGKPADDSSQNSANAGDAEPLSKRDVAGALWSTGVIIYHRGKILEALGRQADAEKDFQWLKDRRLPTDDRLY